MVWKYFKNKSVIYCCIITLSYLWETWLWKKVSSLFWTSSADPKSPLQADDYNSVDEWRKCDSFSYRTSDLGPGHWWGPSVLRVMIHQLLFWDRVPPGARRKIYPSRHYENISIERMQNFRLTCSHRSIHESRKNTKGSVFNLNQAYYYYKRVTSL